MLILLDAEALYAWADFLLRVGVHAQQVVEETRVFGVCHRLAATILVTNGADSDRRLLFAGVDSGSDLELRHASSLSDTPIRPSSFFSRA